MSSYVRNTNGFNGSVSVGSVQFAAISSTCETERAVDNLGVWNDSNVKNTITSNDFYKKIKEIGVPVEHKDTNDDAKKSIQDNGTKITSIGEKAFYDNTKLQKITILASITEILRETEIHRTTIQRIKILPMISIRANMFCFRIM